MLVNTLYFPSWNMTLSQKFSLNWCHFFTSFCLLFFVISLSIRKYRLRELWTKKTDFFDFFFSGSYTGQPVLPLPQALFPALPSTDFWHLQLLLGLAFGSWSLPDISWGLWPPQLCWTDLQTGPGNQPEIHSRTVQGQRRKPVGSPEKTVLWLLQESQDLHRMHSTCSNFMNV